MADTKPKKTAIIIGGGPAGLTAAYELLQHTDVHPIVLEADPTYVGGISKTVKHNGNRIDIGGHRFFSKSDRVMDWWQHILPIESTADSSDTSTISYQGKQRHLVAKSPAGTAGDDVMLLRRRVSRIYYNRNFFSYPISLSVDTLRKLGPIKLFKIGISYGYRALRPRHPETTLEDFFVNRFGDELYKTFFKSYTEKVWGKSCNELSADWGAQRIKGLSITKALIDALSRPFRRKDVKQKGTETSLIEQFLYPKYGPGHLWEVVAKRIQEKGGEIRMGMRVNHLELAYGKVVKVTAVDTTGELHSFEPDYTISTTSIKDLVAGMGTVAPEKVRLVAAALEYRDFVTVGLLLPRQVVEQTLWHAPDTWIYVHEPNVLVGRIQIFNNWSPYLVAKEDHLWVGLEYFCTEGDSFWQKSDAELKQLAIDELVAIGLLAEPKVSDATVLRERKTYPVHAGAYERFGVVRDFLDSISNLFPIGRNGMHRYNNQDHSMLTAMEAVAMIGDGRTDKSVLWEVNTEQDYHEDKDVSKKQSFIRRALLWLRQRPTEQWLFTLSILFSLATVSLLVMYNQSQPQFPVLMGDSAEYYTLAQHLFYDKVYSLSEAAPFVPEGFRPPGYPIFLATFFPFLYVPLGYVALQIVLYALAVVMVYRLVRLVISPTVALLTGLLMAFNPNASYLSSVILTEMLFFFLFILSLYWFVRFAYTKQHWLMAGSGIALAAAMLTRPIAMFLPILFFIVYIFWHHRYQKIPVVRPLLIFVVAIVLTITPWLMRNQEAFGVATISSVGPFNLHFYNAAGHLQFVEGISFQEARERLTPAAVTALPPNELRSPATIALYSDETKAYLKEHFFSYAMYHSIKTIPFFFGNSFADILTVIAPQARTSSNLNISTLIMKGEMTTLINVFKTELAAGNFHFVTFIISLIGWTMICALAGVTAMVAWLRDVSLTRQQTVFIMASVAFIAYFAVLTGPVSFPRYRLPAEPFLFMLAAVGMVWLYHQLRIVSKR